MSGHLAQLAEAYMQVGQVDEGMPLLAEALALVDTTGERHTEAELHRLHGELLLRQGAARRTEISWEASSSRVWSNYASLKADTLILLDLLRRCPQG
jgi:predicted negative regulator of RcsB-dependent stress response